MADKAASNYNPFAKRENFSRSNLIAYKVLTIVSWFLVVIPGIYYTFNSPKNCHRPERCHTIWGQNDHRPSPFALSSVVTSIYWVVTLILQAQYVRYLYGADESYKNSAANVGSHFIFHNLLSFGFLLCWVRGRFWIGELLLIINLFNLTGLYFRHSTYPRLIHIPIVSAPLAWNYIAIFWCGAAAVNARNLPARIVANIFIWGILVLGAFFLAVFKDYTMGFCFTVLAVSLGLGQLFTKVIAFQWIFAFVIAGVLFVLTIVTAIPRTVGQDKVPATGIVSEDRERQPLLDDQ